jgi:hypothetical protein
VCSVDPCESGGLRSVQIAMKTTLPRLCVGSALEGEVGLDTGSLGLRVGPVRVLLFRCEPAAEILFLSLHRRQLLKQVAAPVFHG